MNSSVSSSYPITVKVTEDILNTFRKNNISTSWSMDDFDQGQGWLLNLKTYTFKRSITIEGPCGFYGGPYGPNAWTANGGLCTMGGASYSHSPLPEGLIVGRYCSIGKGLRFLDFSHPTEWVSSSVAFFKPSGVNSSSSLAELCDRLSIQQNGTAARLNFDPRSGKEYPVLGNDIWIGENVTIALGVNIGNGAVLAANSLVTRHVPPYAIVGGVPAKILKHRFSLELIKKLNSSQWWNYCFSDFKDMNFENPVLFLEQLAAREVENTISLWAPDTLNLPSDLDI